MSLVILIGRLLILLALYGTAFTVARMMWQGRQEPGSAFAILRKVSLNLRRATGSIMAGETPWPEGTDLELPLPVTFGRQAGNTVRIEDAFVSACHAELISDGDALWLIDRGSKNGTWIGRKKLDRPIRIEPGEEFTLGGTAIRLAG